MKIYSREYKLTTDHAASSYGVPVIVDVCCGRAFGWEDRTPEDDLAVKSIAIAMLTAGEITEEQFNKFAGI